jgi:hypothetical protein
MMIGPNTVMVTFLMWCEMSNDDPIRRRLKQFGAKLPESRDEYYDTAEARIDTIIGGDSAHYIRLRRCKESYDKLADAVPIGQGFLTFNDFVREWYGIEMEFDGENVCLDYRILDERKYTVFVLKFSV